MRARGVLCFASPAAGFATVAAASAGSVRFAEGVCSGLEASSSSRAGGRGGGSNPWQSGAAMFPRRVLVRFGRSLISTGFWSGPLRQPVVTSDPSFIHCVL